LLPYLEPLEDAGLSHDCCCFVVRVKVKWRRTGYCTENHNLLLTIGLYPVNRRKTEYRLALHI